MGTRPPLSATRNRDPAGKTSAYLDASAAVKLIVADRESEAAGQIGCFVTYDSDQTAAASALGWQVSSPAP